MSLKLSELRTKMKYYTGNTGIADDVCDNFLNDAYINIFFDLPREILFPNFATTNIVELSTFDSQIKQYYLEIDKADLIFFESDPEPKANTSSASKIRYYYGTDVLTIVYRTVYNVSPSLTTADSTTILPKDLDLALAMKASEMYCYSVNETDKATACGALFQRQIGLRKNQLAQGFIQLPTD